MFGKNRQTMARALCLIICFCILGQSVVFAAPEAVSVNVGKQTFQVSPGQWITVKQGSKVLHYNVRYINGHPVALTEGQYYQLVLGEREKQVTSEKGLAEKVSESNPGVIPDRQTQAGNSAPAAGKPIPYASTAEGKIQKSSIRAGVTVAAKVLSGKTGAPKSQPGAGSNGSTASSQESNPPSKADVGLAKATSKIKSGLDPKNILFKAGISVGVELATQIVRGEKPSAKKALGVVTSAEFAGNVVGSALGAAAGSFMVPFLSAVPVIGGALSAFAPTFGAIAGGSYGAYLAGDVKNGKFSFRDAFQKVNWVDVTGRSVGATVGGFLGATLFPPFGMFIGGILGGTIGALAAKALWGIFQGKPAPQDVSKNVSVPGSARASRSQPVPDAAAISVGSGKITSAALSSSPVPEILASQPVTPDGNTGSAVAEAFSKYQSLYQLYNEKVKAASQEEVVEVGLMMNQAKAEYERIKTSLGQ